MRIAIAADHAGYLMKDQLAEFLRGRNYDVQDLGTNGPASVDYPDYSEAVAKTLLEGLADRGILICGSGIGAAIAANKIPGIRAGQSGDTYSAHQGVEHDNVNILVLAARVIGPALAQELVTAFLGAHYKGHEPGQERLQRRLDKIESIERRYAPLAKGTA